MGGRMWIVNAGHIEKEYRKPIEGLLLQEKQWLGDCLEFYRLDNDMGKRWEHWKVRSVLHISWGWRKVGKARHTYMK